MPKQIGSVSGDIWDFITKVRISGFLELLDLVLRRDLIKQLLSSSSPKTSYLTLTMSPVSELPAAGLRQDEGQMPFPMHQIENPSIPAMTLLQVWMKRTRHEILDPRTWQPLRDYPLTHEHRIAMLSFFQPCSTG